MDAERKNYYEVLEVETNASPNQIETAYMRARNSYSGDSVAMYSLMTKEECNAILNQIEEAYSVLGFPEKRREYDRIRGLNQSGAGIKTDSKVTPPSTGLQYESFGSNLMESKVAKITAQKKFGLEFKEDAAMERKISECSDFSGAFLKEIREYKDVSIDRMAEMTRVSKTHLSAIENDDIAKLPADVYVRGYVYQFAKSLKLNPEFVASSYMLHFKKMKSLK